MPDDLTYVLVVEVVGWLLGERAFWHVIDAPKLEELEAELALFKEPYLLRCLLVRLKLLKVYVGEFSVFCSSLSSAFAPSKYDELALGLYGIHASRVHLLSLRWTEICL